MRKGMVVDYKVVAGLLASEDDATQAEFFDVFVRALKVECGTEWFRAVQLSAIRAAAMHETREVMDWEE